MSTRIQNLANRLLQDGRVSATDATRLVAEAALHDGFGISAQEKAALKDVYQRNKDKFDGGAKAVFERFLGRLDVPPPRPPPAPQPPVTPPPAPQPPVQPRPPVQPPPTAGGPETATYVAGHNPWTTTYWPMAGHGVDDEGSPSSNLWAKGGSLEKFDKLLEARGLRSGALAEERKPALNWLVGQPKGNYIPNSSLNEADAERTTGVDFNRDGKITADVKWDFLDGYGNFGKDGKTDGTMSVGWWGSCDKVAAAGAMFKEPKKDVTLNGVTFSAQDIKGLLTVIADSQMGGSEFVGNRYDANYDEVRLANGQTLRGRIQTPVELYQAGMRRSGDLVTIDGSKLPADVTVRLTDGTEKTVKNTEIRTITREDPKDDPVVFHDTITRWLKEGRAAVMDKDSGEHVWNYNFWKASDKIWRGAERPDWARDAEPSKLVGFGGPTSGGKIVFVERDVALGGGDHGPNLRYWMEEKNGKFVNGGWMSDNPDFLWRPARTPSWRGPNARNSFIDPAIVKELYDKSIE